MTHPHDALATENAAPVGAGVHAACVDEFRHSHGFLGRKHGRNESRVLIVAALTAVTMVAEIACGAWFGSMALLADGWHMATHVLALGIAAVAYRYARLHQRDARFSFGAGKAGDLAAFASALMLALVALGIVYESFNRLAVPVPIQFAEAMLVAVLGLVVNLVSAWLLAGHHDHGHAHANAHSHGHAHAGEPDHRGAPGDHRRVLMDHNARAAFMHVLTDAGTSVLAIVGIAAAWAYGWIWADPLMGLVGAAVIVHWAASLMRQSSAVLLDAVPDPGIPVAIRAALETEGDQVADLHLWRLGPGAVAAIVSIVSDHPLTPGEYKQKLGNIAHLAHVTVEVQPCVHAPPVSH
jgi:cation diffusion facilitator family transporter